MSNDDVTLRLRLLDEFSTTTSKFVGELKTMEGSAATSAANVSASANKQSAAVTSAYESVKQGAEIVRTNWLMVAAATAAATSTIVTAMQAVERWAGYAEIREQLNQLAGQYGTTGRNIVESIREITGGQLSLEQSTAASLSALKNSLNPEMIAGIARAAVAFNDAAGTSAAQAFEQLAEGISKGNARAVASIVGKGGIGDAMKDLSESATDAEKSQALFNAVMAKTAVQVKLTAGAVQSLDDSIARSKADWANFTLLLSQFATTGAYGIAGVFTGLAAAMTRVAAAATAAYASLQVLSLDFKGAEASGQAAKDLWGSAGELSAKADQYMKLAASVGDVDKATSALSKAQAAEAASAKRAADAERQLADVLASPAGPGTPAGAPSAGTAAPKIGAGGDNLVDLSKWIKRNAELAEEVRDLLKGPSETAKNNAANLAQTERHAVEISQTALRATGYLEQIGSGVSAIKGSAASIAASSSAASSSLAAMLALQQSAGSNSQIDELKVHTRYFESMYSLMLRMYDKMGGSSSGSGSGSGSQPKTVVPVRSGGTYSGQSAGQTNIYISGVVGDERAVARKINAALVQARRYREVA